MVLIQFPPAVGSAHRKIQLGVVWPPNVRSRSLNLEMLRSEAEVPLRVRPVNWPVACDTVTIPPPFRVIEESTTSPGWRVRSPPLRAWISLTSTAPRLDTEPPVPAERLVAVRL